MPRYPGCIQNFKPFRFLTWEVYSIFNIGPESTSLVCYISFTIVIVNSSLTCRSLLPCVSCQPIQSKTVIENAWQMMFMIHEFMNER